MKTFNEINIGDQVWKKYDFDQTWIDAKRLVTPGWRLPTKDDFQTLLNEMSERRIPFGEIGKILEIQFYEVQRFQEPGEYFPTIVEQAGLWSSTECELDHGKNHAYCLSFENVDTGDWRSSKNCSIQAQAIKSKLGIRLVKNSQ